MNNVPEMERNKERSFESMKQTDIKKALEFAKGKLEKPGNDKVEDLGIVFRSLPKEWIERIILKHKEMIGYKKYADKFFAYHNNLSSVAPDVHDCIAAAVWLCNN